MAGFSRSAPTSVADPPGAVEPGQDALDGCHRGVDVGLRRTPGRHGAALDGPATPFAGSDRTGAFGEYAAAELPGGVVVTTAHHHLGEDNVVHHVQTVDGPNPVGEPAGSATQPLHQVGHAVGTEAPQGGP